MCEFCNNPADQKNRDATHLDFAGFFSSEAIDAAVRQANADRTEDDSSSAEEGDDDTDGT